MRDLGRLQYRWRNCGSFKWVYGTSKYVGVTDDGAIRQLGKAKERVFADEKRNAYYR